MSRRKFVKALVAGSALLSCTKSFASLYLRGNTIESNLTVKDGNNTAERILHLYNVHTYERLSVTYAKSGIYDPDALNQINYFLRCHYTGEVMEMDTRLLDLLCDIKNTVQKDCEVQVISGYRSPDYNELLARQGKGVSRSSLHLRGLAIDFVIEGMSNDKLAGIAKSFSAGGVGTYPEFIHIDVGRVRYW